MDNSDESFNPVNRDFVFLTLVVRHQSAQGLKSVWKFQSREPGFCLFNLRSLAQRATAGLGFQSREPGFCLFNQPRRTKLILPQPRRFNPVNRDFVFLTMTTPAAAQSVQRFNPVNRDFVFLTTPPRPGRRKPRRPFQSREPGFCLFNRIRRPFTRSSGDVGFQSREPGFCLFNCNPWGSSSIFLPPLGVQPGF